MAFKILKDIDDKGLIRVPISSITVTVGELLEQLTGATAWTECTSSSPAYSRKGIAMEAASTAATTVLVCELDGTETVEALVTNTAAAADNGDAMVLTDSVTVNNTHTNSTAKEACFVQDGIGSTTTTVVGRIIVGPGLSFNAA